MSIQGPVHAFPPDPKAEDRLSPEIAFLLAHGVEPELLVRAERLARQSGVTADLALLRSGLLDQARFYGALARELGLPFETDRLAVHPMARFPEAVLGGLVPLLDRASEPQRFAYAPTGEAIARMLAAKDRLPAGLVMATRRNVQDSVLLSRGASIAAHAADGLARKAPHLSYRDGMSARQAAVLSLACLLSGALYLAAPVESSIAAAIALGLLFLGSTVLRLAALLEPIPTEPARPPTRAPDHRLPVYTILVALHREGRVLPKLVRALSALDYPPAKLDIKLILETGDLETLTALGDVQLPGFMEVVIAPPGAPRTKPRALNVALPLSRGEFVAVYDAEDVPDPGQLRLAVSTFTRSEPDVACLQARLVIDNAADGLLTRLFAIEYATLFDVTNPALARFDLPVPLGGTSNHFRADILKGLGGWDAWNVTEDADLGIRLAAAGYRVNDLPSPTREEAPRHLGAWLRQRSRWMKGFLQVSITHSRRPLRNLRELGPARLFGATAVTLGTVASAFGYPVFMVIAFDALLSGRLLVASAPAEIAAASIGVTLFGAGLLALVLPPVLAVRRRRWWWLLPLTLLMPLYYVLVTVAAWRGLLELLLAPARWNKTEHGLARTSAANLL